MSIERIATEIWSAPFHGDGIVELAAVAILREVVPYYEAATSAGVSSIPEAVDAQLICQHFLVGSSRPGRSWLAGR